MWARESEASKYTKDFESVFGTGRFSWCAAFIRWCLNNYSEDHGLGIPIQLQKHRYSLALCEQWEEWAKENGWFIKCEGEETKREIQPGDLVLFDWDFNDWHDHMGVFINHLGNYFICAEGNYHNATTLKVRNWDKIAGLIRITDGWVYEDNAIDLAMSKEDAEEVI